LGFQRKTSLLLGSNAMLSILGPPTSHICACFKLLCQTARCWKCGDVLDSSQCVVNTELSKPNKLKKNTVKTPARVLRLQVHVFLKGGRQGEND